MTVAFVHESSIVVHLQKDDMWTIDREQQAHITNKVISPTYRRPIPSSFHAPTRREVLTYVMYMIILDRYVIACLQKTSLA